ncbi:P-loop NTPase [Bifidobacterium ramosum]|nr:P-loop NTPase [Bifidobacterium ramosum]
MNITYHTDRTSSQQTAPPQSPARQSSLTWQQSQSSPSIRSSQRQSAYLPVVQPQRAPIQPAHPQQPMPTTCGNIITCTSPSGGVGLSVVAAMLARALHARHESVALIDADFVGGGLDVLLGMENDPGTRFETIDAPLGRVEGDALNHELPSWDGVRLLAFDSWNGPPPDWWQAQATIRALADANHVAIVDAGRGAIVAEVDELACNAHLVVVELSVLGLARARTHLDALRHRRDDVGAAGGGIGSGAGGGAVAGADGRADVLVVGAWPRGAERRRGAVSPDEAADYLGCDVAGPLADDPKLRTDVLTGLGIQSVGSTNRRAVDAMVRWADGLLGGAPCDP